MPKTQSFSKAGRKIACLATADISIRFLLLRQLKYMQAAGYDVTAICADGPYVNQITANGIPVITLNMSRGVTSINDLKCISGLINIFRRERFDVVHTHTPKAGVLGRIAGKLAGVPFVAHTDLGLYFLNMHPLKRRVFIWMERFAGGLCDVMLFEDEKAMEFALQERLCRAGKARWIGGGIDLTEFHRKRIKAADIKAKKAELGLPQESVVIGMVARLVKEKGYCEFFEAARMILKQRPDVRFLAVGPVDYEKKDAITPEWVRQKYGLNEEIAFAGVRLDMPAVYAAMDAFVLPTHRDSWPRSPMEAAAMELPVVLSDLPGVAPMVTHGSTGYTVPVGNSSRLADAVLQIIQNPGEARAMGLAGRRLAEARFDERKVFRRVADNYREKRPAAGKGIFLK
ncbi:MAG: glycosyltransferase family 4 protein [Nitrospiraceae bacterium]|nr:glycosyltransferase family 4 protein [Nitrospiraceae bacterium]